MPSTTLCFVLSTIKKNFAEIRLAEEIRREHRFFDIDKLWPNFIKYRYF